MLASVYRTRDRGIKLPRPQSPVTGELLVAEESRGDEKMLIARLMGNGEVQMLPALFRVRYGPLTRNGIVIHGVEPLTRGQQKSKVQYLPQTWWAFIHTESGLYCYDGNDPLDFMADDAILNKNRRHFPGQ